MIFRRSRLPKPVKTPTVLQMEAVECGAAALSIMMGYYGRYVTLEELRIACGVSRDGSKASHILSAAMDYGFQANGFTIETNELKQIKPPYIVFWNFNHFLVVEGFKKGDVYLNDPAKGRRRVTEQEFDEAFTGVVLTVMPGPEFVPGGQKPHFLPALLRRLQGQKSTLFYLILAGLALVIPGMMIPVFSKIFVDDCLLAHNSSWLVPLFIGLLLTALARGALTWVQSYYLLRFKTKLALTSAAKFFWHTLCLPVVFYSQRYAGDIANRVAINDQIAQLLSNDFINTFLSILTVVFYLALMFSYNVFLTLTGVAVALINVLVLQKVSRLRTELSQKISIEGGKLSGSLMSGLHTIETLKASGMEGHFFDTLSGRLTGIVNAQQEIGGINQWLFSLTNLLPTVNMVAILGLGGYLVMRGHLTVGTLVAFQSLMISFMQPFQQLIQVGTKLQEMQGSMNRVDDVLRYPVEADLPLVEESLEKRGRLSGRIEFRNVTFGYSRLAPPLLENFNLVIEPGQWVGIMGGAQSGRSTIIRLMMGLYQPWEGEILFDGQPRSAYNRETLVSSIACVNQEVTLFDGNIRDNLTLWDAGIPGFLVILAAEDAEIHSIITARPGGYGARLEEGGVNFSGGERQRLELARALAQYPSILVLDDATSALDAPLEKRIYDNLRARPMSVILVAHRLSAFRECDQIIVLEQGKVIQQGSHDTLLQDSTGKYASLLTME